MTEVILSDTDWKLLRQMMADAVNAGRGSSEALEDLEVRNATFKRLQQTVLRSAVH